MNPADATEQTPLLEELGLVVEKEQTTPTMASTLEPHNTVTTGPAQKHAQANKTTFTGETEKNIQTNSAEKHPQQDTAQTTPDNACVRN